MSKVTYLAKDGDLPVTTVGGVDFVSGTPVDLPPHKEWLASKLIGNAWFTVEYDKPQDVEETTQTAPPAESVLAQAQAVLQDAHEKAGELVKEAEAVAERIVAEARLEAEDILVSARGAAIAAQGTQQVHGIVAGENPRDQVQGAPTQEAQPGDVGAQGQADPSVAQH